ncbi:hypothetical protein [Aestuariivivens sp. NBU2969]|uniref:hypothetical protein n=1 Tax=Aestuariivivens sp. NBU2969 TaxID=2873267 RepID=UPI001CC0571C|nr:hypothetical protein [Aestuariivivens sp. NBU2969]
MNRIVCSYWNGKVYLKLSYIYQLPFLQAGMMVWLVYGLRFNYQAMTYLLYWLMSMVL